MTISSANLVANTNTFGDWLIKTNVLVDALTNDIVTLSPNDNQGNVVVNGSIQSETLYVDTLSGGAIGVADVVTISSNATFQKTTTIANTVFSGANVSLGLAANVQIKGANSTHKVLIANNTTNKLDFKFVPNFDVTSVVSPANNTFLIYDTTLGGYKAASGITIVNGNLIVDAGISANGSLGTNGQVLLSNGTVAYWGDDTTTLSDLGIANHNTITVNASGNLSTTGNTTSNNLILSNGISANGSYGTSGQVLLTNGTKAYWGDDTTTLSDLGIDNHDTITVNANGDITAAGDFDSNNAVTVDAFSGNTYKVRKGSARTTTTLTLDKSMISWTPAANCTINNSTVTDATGLVFFNNTANNTVSLASGIYMSPDQRAAIETTGVYMLTWYCDGTNTYMASSPEMTSQGL